MSKDVGGNAGHRDRKCNVTPWQIVAGLDQVVRYF